MRQRHILLKKTLHSLQYTTILFLIFALVGCNGSTIKRDSDECHFRGEPLLEIEHLVSTSYKTPVVATAFSPDGTQIYAVYAGEPGALVSWRFHEKPELIREVELDQVGQRAVHFSQDSNYLVISSGRVSGTPLWQFGTDLTGIQIWDVSTGQLAHHYYEGELVPNTPNYVNDAVLSPDNRMLLEGGTNGYGVTNADTGKGGMGTIIFENFHICETTFVQFDSTGNRFAYGVEDGSVNIMHFVDDPDNKFEHANAIFGPRQAGSLPVAGAFHPKKNWMAILYEDSLQVVNLTLILGKTFPHGSIYVGDVAFSPDGQILAVAKPGGLEVYTTNGWAMTPDSRYEARSVAFSPVSCQLAIGDAEGYIHIYDFH